MQFVYDVIVVGAGHAGCESAAAAANLGASVLLITMDMNKIAQMSCNPAVGGIAKGQIVREIDALGGYMGMVSDDTAIQFRMLNRSKGAAMWSPRVQSDRSKFIDNWRKILDSFVNIEIWQDVVNELIIDKNEVLGVKTLFNMEFRAKSVILTAGTFLNGKIHVGKIQFSGGRISEPSSYGISEQLVGLGFEKQRMKTGTPVRINGNSVDFSKLIEQKGDSDFHKFSYLYRDTQKLTQRPCWITHTNEQTHRIIQSSIDHSPLYNGQIQSIGPRYCPSIETKIVTFADRSSHQLFLEPEGEFTQEFYLNGFSSSLPVDVQLQALRTINGFEKVNIYRPGYAIEYDCFNPIQLNHTLETKLIKNLFFAGQINGTTGYEEAAGQGIIAGINAAINCFGGNPFCLTRDEAYIGVLIDDLITKGVDEPYRMFTSRAEYRILLRQDNADQRLTEKSFNIGLAKQDRLNLLKSKMYYIEKISDFAKNFSVSPTEVNGFLEQKNSATISQKTKLHHLILRPNITIFDLIDVLPKLKEQIFSIEERRREEIVEDIEILIKYRGYIEREKLIAEKIQRLDFIEIAKDVDYAAILSLTTEARQKLSKHKPKTIGEASRISGVSPNDISVLLVLCGR